MRDQKDRNLIVLTSAAAWLRGTEVATQLVLIDPNPQGLAVIRQPDLARHLVLQLDALPPRMKNNPLLAKVQQTFAEMVTILDSMGVTPESDRSKLQQIHDAAAGLVKEILNVSGGTPSPVPSPFPAAATMQGGSKP